MKLLIIASFQRRIIKVVTSNNYKTSKTHKLLVLIISNQDILQALPQSLHVIINTSSMCHAQPFEDISITHSIIRMIFLGTTVVEEDLWYRLQSWVICGNTKRSTGRQVRSKNNPQYMANSVSFCHNLWLALDLTCPIEVGSRSNCARILKDKIVIRPLTSVGATC